MVRYESRDDAHHNEFDALAFLLIACIKVELGLKAEQVSKTYAKRRK